MVLSPYRLAVRRAARVLELGDLDLLAVFAILWVVCAADVIASVVRHDVFGTQETLAFSLVLVLPWLLLRSYRRP